MDEDEEMAELRAQEARRVREEAKKCLRHASFQLGKAAYEIDEYLKDFSTARIPIRRRGCTEFCVNGLMAGNRRISWIGYDLKHKESSNQRSH